MGFTEPSGLAQPRCTEAGEARRGSGGGRGEAKILVKALLKRCASEGLGKDKLGVRGPERGVPCAQDTLLEERGLESFRKAL